jgi:predicted ATPase
MNDYGAIADWPDGFFDQSQAEAEQILRAATLKRQSLKEKPRDVEHND